MPVIQQHFHPSRDKLPVQALRNLHLKRLTHVRHHQQMHLKRREAQGPHQASLVMMLLHYGLHQASDPHTVTAHPQGTLVPVGVREGCLHG